MFWPSEEHCEICAPQNLRLEQHRCYKHQEHRDYLAEAGRILRGETMMIAERCHLEALQQLVREAYAELYGTGDAPTDILDWFREARKVL